MDSGDIEQNAAARVIVDEDSQTVANRIAVGGADHCLPNVLLLEAARERPRKPVLMAVAARIEAAGGLETRSC